MFILSWRQVKNDCRLALSLNYILRAQSSTMAQDGRKHRKNIHLIIHFPMSEGVSKMSEQTSERSEACEWSKQGGASEWVGGASERTIRRVAQYFILDPCIFWTIVSSYEVFLRQLRGNKKSTTLKKRIQTKESIYSCNCIRVLDRQGHQRGIGRTQTFFKIYWHRLWNWKTRIFTKRIIFKTKDWLFFEKKSMRETVKALVMRHELFFFLNHFLNHFLLFKSINLSLSPFWNQ